MSGPLRARLIFDLDGTLVDSIPTLTAAVDALLAELGRAPLARETVAGFVGHGVARLVERALLATGGVPGEALAPHVIRYREIYDADPVSGTEVYPSVHAALAVLAAPGHGLGVCTQKLTTPTRAILETLRLMPPILAVTCGDSLGALKPDPRMLAHAAEQLPPGPVVLIGDSEVDAETALAAGVPFLLHAPGYHHGPLDRIPHAAAFDDFAKLPRLVEDVLRAPRAA